MAQHKVPRIPPRGHRYPPDVIEQIYQLRGLRVPDEHMWDMDWPPKGSPQELPLEEVARQCGYESVPDDWHPPKLPNIDEELHNADRVRRGAWKGGTPMGKRQEIDTDTALHKEILGDDLEAPLPDDLQEELRAEAERKGLPNLVKR